MVLILIDTLRADHLPCYGYARETAPYLTALAARSTVFRNAFSTSSWTPPSMASLFTGLYPNGHGVVRGFIAPNDPAEQAGPAGETALELVALPAVPVLTEHLREAGYRTFGVAANLNIGSVLGFDRGFDRFDALYDRPAEELVARALEWRASVPADRPCFVYVHLNDVHKPNEARSPWYERFLADPVAKAAGRRAGGPRAPRSSKGSQVDPIARYDSELAYVDGWIERLVRGLDLGPDALLVVASDHGEEFLDHGNTGHKFSLHGELNRVVLIVHRPGSPGAGAVEAGVSLVDVLPTVLDAAGIEVALDGPGRSLLPLLEPDARPELEPRDLFAHRARARSSSIDDPGLWGVIRGDWKLLRYDPVRTELYDMAGDPGELDDRSSAQRAVARDLARALDAFRRDTELLEGQAVEVTLDAELLDELRALGYAGHEDD